MQPLYIRVFDLHENRTIDITPMPWWRRSARALLALLFFLVAVPLLWLAGAVLGLFVLGVGAVMLGLSAFGTTGAHRNRRNRRDPPQAP